MIETMHLPDQLTLSVDVTEPRQTPLPPERRFAEALAAGVETLTRVAGETVIASLPGGAIAAAATRDPASRLPSGLPGEGAEAAEGPGVTDAEGDADALGDYWRLQQQSQDFNLQFLQLQENLSQENRRFSTLSNVLKARHDTAKTVIQNIR